MLGRRMIVKFKRNKDGYVDPEKVRKAYGIERDKYTRENIVHTCDEACRTCVYCNPESGANYVSGVLVCNYLIVTGEVRGCPAGTGCKQYAKRGQKSEAV